MNYNELKKRREQAEAQKNAVGNVISFKEDTTTSIRIVPSTETLDLKEVMFQPAWVHYSSAGIVRTTTFSPKTFGGVDPVETFINEERANKLELDEFKALMKLSPKLVYITKAIVRGEEDKGVRLFVVNAGVRNDTLVWDNAGQYGELMKAIESAFDGEEVPDITDIREGFDIKVSVESPAKSGNKYKTVSYGVARKESPLSEDKKLLKAWVDESNHPSWKEAYAVVSTEQLDSMLSKFLDSGGEPEEEDEETTATNKTSSRTGTRSTGRTASVETEDEEDDFLKKAEAKFKKMTTNTDESFDSEPSVDVLETDDFEDDDDLPF
jgi:hypothetical protein